MNKNFSLVYAGSLLEENEVKEFSDELNKYGWALYPNDIEKQIRMSESEILNTIYVTLNDEFIKGVLSGIVANAVFLSVQNFILKLWKNNNGKKINKYSPSRGNEKVNISVGFHAENQNTEYVFKLNGEGSEEIIKESIEKAFEFMKLSEYNKKDNNNKEDLIVNYDIQNNIWKA